MPQTVERKETILKVLECNELSLSTRGVSEGLMIILLQ